VMGVGREGDGREGKGRILDAPLPAAIWSLKLARWNLAHSGKSSFAGRNSYLIVLIINILIVLRNELDACTLRQQTMREGLVMRPR